MVKALQDVTAPTVLSRYHAAHIMHRDLKKISFKLQPGLAGLRSLTFKTSIATMASNVLCVLLALMAGDRIRRTHICILVFAIRDIPICMSLLKLKLPRSLLRKTRLLVSNLGPILSSKNPRVSKL
jgi:hypothetical protein